MVGQEHVVQALTHALTQQRLHHAYLFTGTRGVGKTTVSRILAKSLNCTGPDGNGGITATPCGVCPACTAIDAGRFVDYTELDAASNRGVDEVQQLLEQAVYKPVEGRFKVFMIDEVHMLSNTAFNAMLKTLEEPPEYLKFVLATTDPQKVPVTVLSRCLQFNLRPMAPETILAHLQGVLAQEQIDADAQALRLIARAARGSMRDALSLADQAIAFSAGRLQESAVRQMLGSVDRGVVFELIGALAAADGRTVVERIDHLREQGMSAATVLEDMATALQRMAVRQAVPDMSGLDGDAADADAAEIARLAAVLPPDETQLLYSLCIHGRAELGLAPDEYAGLTMTLLRLLPFKAGDGAVAAASTAPPASVGAAAVEKKTLKSDAGSDGAVSRRPDAARIETCPPAQENADDSRAAQACAALGDTAPDAVASADGGAPVADVSFPPTAAEEAASVTAPGTDGDENASRPSNAQARMGADARGAPPAAYADFWHALVRQLVEQDAVTALARELALQSELVERAPGGADGAPETWTLRIENTSLAQSATGSVSATRERLQAALAQAGHTVRLRVVTGPVADSPALRNAIVADNRMKAAQTLLQADPFVQAMMREFGATIVPGSVKPL